MVNILFGSNKFIDANGIISFKGKELFKYDLSALKPLITTEIRDENGVLLGKVWKSTSFVHCHDDYFPISEYDDANNLKRLALRRKLDGLLVFELIIKGPDDIEINGRFHIKGFQHPIIATKDKLKIGPIVTLSHNTFIRTGRGIDINEQGIGIG